MCGVWQRDVESGAEVRRLRQAEPRKPPLTDVKDQLPGLWILGTCPDPGEGLSGDQEVVMRNSRMGIPTVAWLLLSLALTAAAQQKVDLGRREYLGKCAVCHGTDGKGSGLYGEQLKRKPSDLTTLAQRNGGVFPVNRTYEVIEGAGAGHGTREMPVWGMDYTVQATEQLPDLPYNQALYVRTRIMALLEYLNQLQVK